MLYPLSTIAFGDGAMATDSSTATNSPSEDAAAASALPAVGGYQILREIARGGQGIVYQALQLSTRRKVALKILLDGQFAAPAAQKRFGREIELAARLNHANIVTVFDSGTTADGRLFCAMDYVRGTRIDQYVRENRPDLPAVLKRFRMVCDAVAHAHQRGVIHRDLKTSNIVVDPEGSPHVLDFGLAKTMGDDPLISLTGQLVGTLRYMSPEQTRGNPDEIDTRSDVYALGVILYELLTDRQPYPAGKTMEEALRHITSSDPIAPERNWSEKSGVVRRDGKCPIDDELSTIILKAMAKQRERRYQSAAELSADLGRYLDGEAIEAKRDSALYLLRKTIHRYRGRAAAVALVLAVATAGLVVSTTLWRRAATDRDRAEAAERKAQIAQRQATVALVDEQHQRETAQQAVRQLEAQNLLSQLVVARSMSERGDFSQARAELTSIAPVDSIAQDWHWAAWEYLRASHELSRQDLNSQLPAASQLQAARSSGGAAWIDMLRGRILTWSNGLLVAFSLETGKMAPFESADLLVAVPPNLFADEVHREATKGGRHVRMDCVRKSDQTISTIELLRPDGTTQWKETIPPPGLSGAGALSIDGTHLALAMENGTIQIRQIRDDRSVVEMTIGGIADDVLALAFDPLGRRLHVITGGWVHYVFSVTEDPDISKVANAHQSTTRCLAFDRYGRLLVSGSYDGHVKVWDAATHAPLADLTALEKGTSSVSGGLITGVTQVGFLPDDRVYTATIGGIVKVWDWRTGTLATCKTGNSDMGGIAVGDDGDSMYVIGHNAIDRFDILTGQVLGQPFGQTSLGGLGYRAIWLADRNLLFATRTDGTPDSVRCEIWDLTGPTLLRVLRHQTDSLRDADLSPDGQTLALASRDGTVTLWDWQHGSLLRVLDVRPGHAHSNIVSAVKFAPNQPVVVTASHDNRVIFWSTQSGRELAEVNVDEHHDLGYGPTGQLKDIAFSPDGGTLAITVANGIWWVDLGMFEGQIEELGQESRVMK